MCAGTKTYTLDGIPGKGRPIALMQKWMDSNDFTRLGPDGRPYVAPPKPTAVLPPLTPRATPSAVTRVPRLAARRLLNPHF